MPPHSKVAQAAKLALGASGEPRVVELAGARLRDLGALEELRYPVRQLALGDEQQVQAARRVLAEARRSLYLILAGAPTTDNEASEQ